MAKHYLRLLLEEFVTVLVQEIIQAHLRHLLERPLFYYLCRPFFELVLMLPLRNCFVMLSMIVEQNNNECIIEMQAVDCMLPVFSRAPCRRAQTRIGQFEARTVYVYKKREKRTSICILHAIYLQ